MMELKEERLQKVMAAAGIASRRECEKIILAGRVQVNGKVVKELGTKVGGKAFITVDGKGLKKQTKMYVLMYKPRGV
ncbi:MAG: S4 domain-containing protein, partial [Acidaminococcaceae bacterium]|nr:S4 domain-containing protein [Acidaminococcaceae bacterium]